MEFGDDSLVGTNSVRKLYGIGFGFVYTIGYFLLAIGASGAGHGTFVFFAPLFTWILVVIAIYLSGKADTLFKKSFFIACLVIHYLHIVIFLRPLFVGDIDDGTANAWQLTNGPVMMLLIAGWYLAGQVAIWYRFVRRSLRS